MIDVLIADDHPLVRRAVQDVLATSDDMRVTGEASDGFEAVEKVREGRFDVLVMDVAMPGLTGTDALRQLRSEGESIPVLIFSSYSEEEYAVRLLRAGASGYLHKGTAVDELISAIRVVASGRKYVNGKTAEMLAEFVTRPPESRPHHLLSDREFSVLLLISSGKTVNEVAGHLHLSPATISTYRTRILQKMGMKTNAELTHYAVKNGLV